MTNRFDNSTKNRKVAPNEREAKQKDRESYKAHTEGDGVVRELGEQGLYFGLSALAQVGERVVLEGIEVGLTGTGHDERTDAVRVACEKKDNVITKRW